MRVQKSWIRFRPRYLSTPANYQAVLVIKDNDLGNPSKGYGTPLKTRERFFHSERKARNWIDLVKKSVRTDDSDKPTVSGELDGQKK